MKKVAVILSGCGFRDGSEITEAVSSLIALSELGADFKVYAPSKDVPSTNHVDGSPGETRNTLVESTRIARQDVANIKELSSKSFDALVMPGGYGAALHLSNWAQQGAQCTVDQDVERVINEFFQENKPIAALCIAPAVVARVLGDKGITVTIGNDKDTAAEIAKTGAQPVNCKVDDFVTDRENKIITTPAYMYDKARPNEVFTGVRKAIRELVEMA